MTVIIFYAIAKVNKMLIWTKSTSQEVNYKMEKMWVEECFFFFLSDKKVQNLALDGKNNNPIKYYEWQSN